MIFIKHNLDQLYICKTIIDGLEFPNFIYRKIMNFIQCLIKQPQINTPNSNQELINGLPQSLQSLLMPLFAPNVQDLQIYFKNIIEDLQQKQTIMGPKSFQILLNKIVKIILGEATKRIIQNQQMTSILISTYFQKYFTTYSLELDNSLSNLGFGQNQNQQNQYYPITMPFISEDKMLLCQIVNVLALIHLCLPHFPEQFDEEINTNNEKWIFSAKQKIQAIIKSTLKKKKDQIQELKLCKNNQLKEGENQRPKYTLLLMKLLLGITKYLQNKQVQAKKQLQLVLDKLTTISDNTNMYTKHFYQQFMVICLFYIFQATYSLNQIEVSNYYCTKTYQYAQKLEQKGQKLCKILQQTFIFAHNNQNRKNKVRLNRIEKKLQWVSKKKTNKLLPLQQKQYLNKQSNTMNKLTGKVIIGEEANQYNYQPKSIIKTKDKRVINQNRLAGTQSFQLSKQKVENQLINILTVTDKKATFFRLRKQNLSYLQKQQRKYKLSIYNNEILLAEIRKKQQKLQQDYKIEAIKQDIVRLKIIENQLAGQYEQLKQKNLKDLKSVIKINKYFATFAQLKQYSRKKIIHEFVYGRTISKTFFYVIFRFLRKKIPKNKDIFHYSKVRYHNILHFVEIYERLVTNTNQNSVIFSDPYEKQPGYYLNIYPIETVNLKSEGNKTTAPIYLQDEIKITLSEAMELKQNPFYLYYSHQQKPSEPKPFLKYGHYKLISWQQKIHNKSFLTIFYTHNFIDRLKKVINKRKNVEYGKKQIKIRYSTNDKHLQHTLFYIISRCQNESEKIDSDLPIFTGSNFNQYPMSQSIFQNQHQITPKTKYSVKLFTISQPNYKNPHYNILINKQWKTTDPSLSQTKIRQIYISQLYKSFNKQYRKITTIQKICRIIYSKKLLANLKQNSKALIKVIVHSNVVFTYRKIKANKAFIVVENITTKDTEIKEATIDIQSFSIINIIREKLAKQNSCKKKVRILLNFIKIRGFINKIKSNLKKINKKSDFQLSYRNRVVFYHMFNSFVYRNKKVNEKIMFTLVVKSLIDFPRPYRFRVFTVQSSINPIDIQMTIYTDQKTILEKCAKKLNTIINIINRDQLILPDNENKTINIEYFVRRNSRYSINSSFSQMMKSQEFLSEVSNSIQSQASESKIMINLNSNRNSQMSQINDVDKKTDKQSGKNMNSKLIIRKNRGSFNKYNKRLLRQAPIRSSFVEQRSHDNSDI